MSSILFAYRTSSNSTTEETPFMLLYGRECTLAPDVTLLPPPKVPRSEKEHRDLLIDNLATAHKIAAERNAEKKKAMKERYDLTATEPKFKEGDLVLIRDQTKKKGVCKKLSDHFIGPYEITEKVGPVTYRLAGMGQKADLVHADRLKPYKTPGKNSIRTDEKTPNPTEVQPEKKTVKKGLTKRAIPAAEELVDKLHSFLESGEDRTKTDKAEKELPKEPPRTIAKHRRRRSSQEYLPLVCTEEPAPNSAFCEAHSQIVQKFGHPIKVRDFIRSCRGRSDALQ